MADAHPRKIELYVTTEGSCPFEDWLTRLKNAKARAKIRVRLDRVSSGNLGDYKSLGSGIFELRIDYGPGYRVYFGQQGEVMVILLCCGDKSSQTSDIRNAEKFWADYKSRQGESDESK